MFFTACKFSIQGQLLFLDVALAVGPVHQLQEAMRKHTCVPVHDQMLLLSDGEILDAQRNVSSYRGAGSNSNPLFLVSKMTRGPMAQVSCCSDIRNLDLCLTGRRSRFISFLNGFFRFEGRCSAALQTCALVGLCTKVFGTRQTVHNRFANDDAQVFAFGTRAAFA